MPQDLSQDEQELINRYRLIKQVTKGKQAHGELSVKLVLGRPSLWFQSVQEKAVEV